MIEQASTKTESAKESLPPIAIALDTLAEARTSEETDYPSVTLAYEIAKNSYEQILKRYDAVEGRLQGLLQTVAGFTTAIVAFVATNNAQRNFWSPWFIAALVAFAFGMCIGSYGRITGRLMLMDPNILWEKWLDKSEWAFRKDYVYFAADHFRLNYSVIDRKAFLTALVSILFAIEATCLAIWVLAPKWSLWQN